LALQGLHRLNRAGGVLEKDAGPVRTLLEGQAKAILAQPGVLLNKLRFRQVQKPGQLGNFVLTQADLAGPPTTGGTPLAFNFELTLWVNR